MKKTPSLDPRRLDIRAFARNATSLSGRCVLRDMPRLAATLQQVGANDGATWRLDGSLAAPLGGPLEPRLHLAARTTVSLQCQRCLEPVAIRLDIDRQFRFVRDEAAAAALDAECEEEVLVESRALDAIGLVEDELLLALPLVPRHERCEVDLMAKALEGPPARQRPFETLAALKKP